MRIKFDKGGRYGERQGDTAFWVFIGVGILIIAVVILRKFGIII